VSCLVQLQVPQHSQKFKLSHNSINFLGTMAFVQCNNTLLHKTGKGRGYIVLGHSRQFLM